MICEKVAEAYHGRWTHDQIVDGAARRGRQAREEARRCTARLEEANAARIPRPQFRPPTLTLTLNPKLYTLNPKP